MCNSIYTPHRCLRSKLAEYGGTQGWTGYTRKLENLYDDTWVVPNDDQWLRINAQDLPNPPAEMTLNMWVEYEHDSNNNGIAEASEYAQVTVYSDGGAPNATYEITSMMRQTKARSNRQSKSLVGWI